MAYRHLGQAPVPTPDVSTTTPLAEQILTKKRGFVAVPTPDMRDYVQAQLITVGIGFLMGMTVGAVLGEKFRGHVGYRGKHVAIQANKRRSQRRTSRRRRRSSRRVHRNVAPSVFLRDETSPLDYHGHHPKRIAAVDPEAPPSPSQTYFTASKIGAPGKRKLSVPGAPIGTVGFLDYDVQSDGSVYIHYIATRQDMRKQGLMRLMVDELFRRYAASAPSINFGNVYSDSVWKLFQEKHRAGHRVYAKLR